ncbi:hypothetical protein V1477_003418 [Vespula maculifrons]|uniref:Uncharacterized protein n=1 Tax=Vespula maculifrons TaxID=7453 RepID=A0ABD2CUK6_VESMC
MSITARGTEWRMLDCVASGLRLGVGGRSFSTRIGPARVITNRDTNVTSANKFQKWKDLEGTSKKKYGIAVYRANCCVAISCSVITAETNR